MELLYKDKYCVVAEKEPGSLSEDTCDNSVPALARTEYGLNTFPVHRIDKAAGGALLLALSSAYAEKLRSAGFDKEYIFITSGVPVQKQGEYRDYLYHDTRTNKSFVVKRQRKGVREAALEYTVIAEREGFALVKAKMLTGRTHQIRLQFSSRRTPLYGDRRYGGTGDNLALWSYKLTFISGGKEHTVFSKPRLTYPWTLFTDEVLAL